MTIHLAYQQLLSALFDIYEDREAGNIADMVIEHVTGFRKIDRITNKEFTLSALQQQQLESITGKLKRNTPVQYALNEAWFAGMKFYVDENVLIPRPETEELVEWIVSEVRSLKYGVRDMIDIGTGSGCIPIALKKKLKNVSVTGIDISEGALEVAEKNSKALDADIELKRVNFLQEADQLGMFDIIVSNPPYIKQSEAASMHPNVLAHEPHTALFVPDEDALLFYRHIAAFGKTHLNENGMIFLEINEALGNEVMHLFSNNGYSTEIKKDMQGKNRMVKATVHSKL